MLEKILYDPETGEFSWRDRKTTKEPGTINSKGYRCIMVGGKMYKAHRIAFFKVHGYWPEQVDHINGDRLDNRAANLRAATNKTNCQNQLGKGFSWIHSRQRFVAAITVDGKNKTIGRYTTPVDAHAAYLRAKRKHHDCLRISI